MILSILIILTILFLICFYIFTRYKEQLRFLQVKLDVAEQQMNSLFDQNLELLKSSCKKLDQLTEEDLFTEVQEFSREGISNYEFYKKLFSYQHDFDEEVRYHASFVPDEETNKLFDDLRIVHLECSASGDFYNDTADQYNSLLERFPVRIVGNILKCKKKDLYSYEEEEVFEILKEEKEELES